jgi:hypothetical protein
MGQTAGDALDPRGLISEAYVIDGISGPECRSIYLDWALGLGIDVDATAATGVLLARYAPDHPDHPMTEVLQEGVEAHARARPSRRRR